MIKLTHKHKDKNKFNGTFDIYGYNMYYYVVFTRKSSDNCRNA
jgi:hypothetical protein